MAAILFNCLFIFRKIKKGALPTRRPDIIGPWPTIQGRILAEFSG
jgi:hypothetical protein